MNETRPSLFFTALPLPCIILNANWKTKKNRGGLGMRLICGDTQCMCIKNEQKERMNDKPEKYTCMFKTYIISWESLVTFHTTPKSSYHWSIHCACLLRGRANPQQLHRAKVILHETYIFLNRVCQLALVECKEQKEELLRSSLYLLVGCNSTRMFVWLLQRMKILKCPSV